MSKQSTAPRSSIPRERALMVVPQPPRGLRRVGLSLLRGVRALLLLPLTLVAAVLSGAIDAVEFAVLLPFRTLALVGRGVVEAVRVTPGVARVIASDVATTIGGLAHLATLPFRAVLALVRLAAATVLLVARAVAALVRRLLLGVAFVGRQAVAGVALALRALVFVGLMPVAGVFWLARTLYAAAAAVARGVATLLGLVATLVRGLAHVLSVGVCDLAKTAYVLVHGVLRGVTFVVTQAVTGIIRGVLAVVLLLRAAVIVSARGMGMAAAAVTRTVVPSQVGAAVVLPVLSYFALVLANTATEGVLDYGLLGIAGMVGWTLASLVIVLSCHNRAPHGSAVLLSAAQATGAAWLLADRAVAGLAFSPVWFAPLAVFLVLSSLRALWLMARAYKAENDGENPIYRRAGAGVALAIAAQLGTLGFWLASEAPVTLVGWAAFELMLVASGLLLAWTVRSGRMVRTALWLLYAGCSAVTVLIVSALLADPVLVLPLTALLAVFVVSAALIVRARFLESVAA